jgi:hypothetical protein
MRKVLMVSPHFPPDNSAGSHRVRLLAPHLAHFGWEPTIVTVDPRDYEGMQDPMLLDLVPRSLRIIRARAWPARWTRRFGVGDLGLRALGGLYRACSRFLGDEQFDALFVTLLPAYPAVLGPLLKRKFDVPFVLDFQDPWIGAWGDTVGPGPNGRPDWKSRASRMVACWLEPHVVRAVDAFTAVSSGTLEQIMVRNPEAKSVPYGVVPLGGEPADFEYLRAKAPQNRFFDPRNGNLHLCYVGTLLPLGFETLRALLRAVALLRERNPELYCRLRLNFFGTSNQPDPDSAQRVLPIAREIGVEDCVREIAPRIHYIEALTVLTQATGIVMMGSSEKHYTASKLYPGLLARRPILALYHEASSVVQVIRNIGLHASVRLITYDDVCRAEARVEEVYLELLELLSNPIYDDSAMAVEKLHEFSAKHLARKMAIVFDSVSEAGRRTPFEIRKKSDIS